MQRKISKLYILIMNLSIVLIFWGGLLRKNFNADTLAHMFSKDADIMVRLADGRYIIALCDSILLKLGIRTTDYISVFSLIALILVTGSITLLQCCFSDFIKNKGESADCILIAGVAGAVSLGCLNVLFIEPLMFTEMSCYFGLAYFCASIGVYLYTKKRYLLAVLMFLISVSTYQFSVVFAAIILVYYILLDEDIRFSFKLLVREVLAIIATFGMGVINLLLIKIIANLGLAGALRKDMNVSGLGDKLIQAAQSLGELYSSAYGLLLHLYIPLLFSIGTLVLCIWVAVKKKDYQLLILSVVANLGCTVLMLILPLMNGSFGLPGRMSFLFFLIQGLSAMLVLYRLEDRRMITILSVGILGYLFVQYIFTSFIITDKYVSNQQDINTVRLVVQAIEDYEEETKEVVDTLVVGYDQFAPDYYENINFHAEQINERTVTIVPISIIRYATGRALNKELMSDEERIAKFGDVNWDELDLKEQLICEGNKAYWCIY